MKDDKRGELRAKINLALQANGAGGGCRERKCQCDYDVGAVPCEYCAIQDALECSLKHISTRPAPTAEIVDQLTANDGDTGAITANILRYWARDKIERFARHLLGDDAQASYRQRKG